MPSSYKETVVDPKLQNLWFPTEYQTVLYRLWGMYSAQKLADILETTAENIRDSWRLMGLDPDRPVNPYWHKRGYITIVRDTWHILSKVQQAALLEISLEEFEIMLREDDFLDAKISYKFTGTQCYWRPLTQEETARTQQIAVLLKNKKKIIGDYPDSAFRFLETFYQPVAPTEKTYPSFLTRNARFIYSYLALYGDPLIDETLDPFPDKLLEEYAKYGVTGVWMQGVLYQLVEYPFDPSLSKGWEIRQKNLQKLVHRAAKYGIGIYLYLNEPRWMPLSFYEKNPHVKGRVVEDKGMACLCTSTPEVQAYLENGTYQLFRDVKGLAGFVTITRSENPTNCYSHSVESNCTCPRCSQRSLPEVIAEVNNLLSRGARRANPNARAIAWEWQWPDGRCEDIVKLMDSNIIFQSTSETNIPLNKGGVPWYILDYSISNPGPGERAKTNWRSAKKYGHECCAKVQFNNTWEAPGAPYIPVFDLVAEHATNLKKEGLQHIMLSWTLGGSPTPNLALATGILDGKYTEDHAIEEMIAENFTPSCTDVVNKAQHIMSQAFREFPFACGVLYRAPFTSRPGSLFYSEETGREAGMVAFPFDDLLNWRDVYPEDIFQNQIAKMNTLWQDAVDLLKSQSEDSASFREFKCCAESALEHFKSVLNLTRFVRARNALMAGKTDVDGRDAKQLILTALDEEESNVIDMIRTQSVESHIGFEASNHYSFTRQNLLEKLLNIDYARQYFLQKWEQK